MNVLHVHSGNLFGGVERMLETLAPATAGVAPVRSSYALCFDGRTRRTLSAAGADVHHLGPVRARRPDEVWRARRALRAALAAGAWHAAIVHSAWSQGIFGPVIQRTGTPLVRWLHAPEPGPRWLETWSAQSRPALVLCNSRYTLEASRARLGDLPAVVAHPPARSMPADPDARATVRRRLGTHAGAVVIAIAARLEPWKGHGLLIEALATLPDLPWELWIIGGPQAAPERQYLEQLRASAAALGARVRFTGEQADVSQWLQAADIYCQPNLSPEPFGLAFVEALSAGLPIVTAGIGAAPEIVTAACGTLTVPNSAVATAAALQALIDDRDRRERMRIAARERALEFCDLRRSLGHLAAALRRVSTHALTPA
jgi:glycosyltransferase involved in cell wall biosynthesis